MNFIKPLGVGLALTSIFSFNAVTAGTALAASFQPTTISLNGNVISQPKHTVSWDGYSNTAFLPVYYMDTALTQIGVQATWDGKTLNLQPNSMFTVDLSNLPNTQSISSKVMAIAINGTVVKYAPRIAAPDPVGGTVTTYASVYQLQDVLNRLGIHSQWDGLNWGMTSGSSTASALVPGRWKPLSQQPINPKCVAYGPDNALYEGAENGLFRKTDTGWALIPASDQISSVTGITWSPDGILTIATSNDYVQQFINGQWQQLGSPGTNYDMFARQPRTFRWYNDGTLLLVDQTGTPWQYRSGIWEHLGKTGSDNYIDVLRTDRLGNGTIVGIQQTLHEGKKLIKYVNGNWVDIPAPPNGVGNDANIAVGSDGKLLVDWQGTVWSQEPNGSWTKISTGILSSIGYTNFLLWQGWMPDGTQWAATYAIPSDSTAPVTMTIWSLNNGRWNAIGSEQGTENSFGDTTFVPLNNNVLLLVKTLYGGFPVNFTMFQNGMFSDISSTTTTSLSSIQGAAITPDGKFSVSTQNGVYSFTNGSWQQASAITELQSFTWAPGGKLVGVSQNKGVVEIQNGQEQPIGDGLTGITAVAYSSTGVLTARTTFDVYQLANGKWNKVNSGPTTAGLCLAFAPDGTITADDGGYIDEYKNGEWVHIAKYPAQGLVTAMKWIGNNLVIGMDGEGVWEYINGKWIDLGLEKNLITGIEESPDHTVYVSSQNQVWSLQQ